jgi:hypothetical protein
MAPRDVRVGKSYASEIIRGINESIVFLVLLDERANVSSHVARELERAVSKRKYIVGCKMGQFGIDPALEYFLGGIQIIEASIDDIDATIGEIARIIREASFELQAASRTAVPADSVASPPEIPPDTWDHPTTILLPSRLRRLLEDR